MGVLLNIQGNCSCLRAKAAHISGHLPTVLHPLFGEGEVLLSVPDEFVDVQFQVGRKRLSVDFTGLLKQGK